MRLKEGIETLMARQNLDRQCCQQVLSELLSPDNDPVQKAAFLVLLRSKTETSDELIGMIAALKEKGVPLRPRSKVLDIVGTGGDGQGTVNISTGSAILAASCGVKIAKHGSGAVTSKAGSADVLTALGVAIDLPPEKIEASIETIGIGFCFAPNFHPLMRALRPLRQQLNVPTSFNLLGPLLNPANPSHIVLGVYDASLMRIMAEVLQKMGTESSLVVHGHGIDELSCLGPVKVIEITATNMREAYIDPKQLGLPSCSLSDLQGGSAATNAQLLLEALQGRRTRQGKAIANTLILNAAVAVYLYGVQPNLAEALKLAKEKLYDGSALKLLNNWIEFSHD